MNACANCDYFDAPQSSYGSCRRRAPQPDIKQNGVALWARVHATDGCGDFEPRAVLDVPAAGQASLPLTP